MTSASDFDELGINDALFPNSAFININHLGISTKSRFNVKLIENNKDKAFEIADDVPSCLVINGDGRNVELLQEESITEMDAFIAVTGNSETNIMSCLVVGGMRKLDCT